MLQARIKTRLGEGADEFMLDVDFTAPPGVTILFGASGSGKSTTLKAIAGMLRPHEGRIQVGEQIFFDSEKRVDLPIRKRRVGYVLQSLALFPHLSVRENIEFGMKDLPKGERHKRAAALLAAFHIEATA